MLLAMLALVAQIAAAAPLSVVPTAIAPVLGLDIPICGHVHHADGRAPADHHEHLLRCARCVCCHAPAMLAAPAARAPLPAAIVYLAAAVPPPATAPPPRLAVRPPPRAPPFLAARPD